MFRRLRRQAPRPGQSMVEFAIVSLALMMLVFGTIDFGRAILQRAMLTNAVREAARYGSVYPGSGTSAMQDAGLKRSPTLAFTLATPTCAPQGTTPLVFTAAHCTDTSQATGVLPGDSLRVCGNYTFQSAIPGLTKIVTIPMSECATVRIQ
jgi:Flp pilus assembly protein TadG